MAPDEGNRQETYSGTKEVAQTHLFNVKRLEAYMETHVEGFKGPLEVRQFKGGQSNPTYQLIAPSGKYVMRRKPPGKLLPSAHAVDREHRIISALHKEGLPVPRTYTLCEDETVTGTIFYIMDCVEGRVFWEVGLPDLTRDERAAIYDSLNETLARLHQVDYLAAGLEDFGKPGNYFARQVSRWGRQYKASQTEEFELMDRLMEWLPENIPEDDSVSIVHGDYKLDNVLIHPTEPKVVAVLDWELSTIGHPLGDLTYLLMPWFRPAPTGETPSLADLDLSSLGIPSADEFAATYCARTGRKPLENIDFYMAYNFFRIGAIHQGIVGRVKDGTASNANADASAALVGPYSELAWNFALKAGAK